MALAEDDFEQIRSRVRAAYEIEEPVVQKFREFAKRLKNEVKPIKPYSANAVSFVSTDGGDNRLYFNPAVIELIRVVDSQGKQCALDAIAGNTEYNSLNAKLELVPPLKRLCEDINKNIMQLSHFLKGLGESGKSTGAARIYRDIVEWAVLYDLLHKEWPLDTIIIREGMLRTKSFKREIFPFIDKKFRSICERQKSKNVNIALVGVAKKNAVLSRLSVALELEETFHKRDPCYVEVPKDIEEECYNHDKAWLDTLETGEPDEDGKYRYESMGKLYLAKFGDQPFNPVWPVDIAEWNAHEAHKILGQLLYDAQIGFPIPDFPQSIQRAHDFASINGIEIEVLQDIFFDEITKNFSPQDQEKLHRIRYLNQNLTDRRYKNA